MMLRFATPLLALTALLLWSAPGQAQVPTRTAEIQASQLCGGTCGSKGKNKEQPTEQCDRGKGKDKDKTQE
ncbi:MAG: hypothetical protein IT445_11400 [Phycisphaeraceae bacterium]|nr:hypothetical protein [Phycisphaeraceae bacterium]